MLELEARAEGPAGAGQDHDPAVVVGGHLGDGGVEVRHQGEGHRVEPGRVVEGDGAHVGRRRGDGDEGHGHSLTDGRRRAIHRVAADRSGDAVPGAVGHHRGVPIDPFSEFDPYGGEPEPPDA